MRTTAWIVLLLAASAATPSSAIDRVWSHTYGGTAADGFRAAVATRDGGVIAVGYTYSFGAGDVDLFAVKTDALGETLWSRTFGGPAPDYGYGVCEMSDGTCVLAGYTMSSGAGAEDVYLVAVDADGDTLWTRTYGGPGLDEARSICFTSDGYLVVAGQSESFGAGLADVYILKVNADGDTLWTRTYGGAGSDWAAGVCETADGCYGASGTTGSFNTTRDAYLVKVTPAGELVWHNRYGSSSPYREEFGVGVCALANGGMAATGWRTDQDQMDPGQLNLLIVGSGGGITDYRRFLDPYIEYGTSICTTPAGDFIICGSAKNTTTHRNDLFLLKKPQTGTWAWAEIMGGTGSDWGCSVVGAEPEYYIIAGYTESPGGGYDGWLLKMSESMATAPDPFKPTQLVLDVPHPNPSGPVTALKFTLPARLATELAVYDAGGRRVTVLAAGVLEAGEHVVAWPGTDDRGGPLSPGVYWARLTAGEGVAARRIVLVR